MLQQFKHANDTIHRGTNFMAHGGQESTFGNIGRFGRIFGVQQLFIRLLGFRNVGV